MRWQSQERFPRHSWLKWQKQMPAQEKVISLAIISQFGPTHQSLPQYSQCFQEEWFSPVQKQNKTNKKRITTSGGCPLDLPFCSERGIGNAGAFLIIAVINTMNTMGTELLPSCSQHQHLLSSATPPSKVVSNPSSASPSVMLLCNHLKS